MGGCQAGKQTPKSMKTLSQKLPCIPRLGSASRKASPWLPAEPDMKRTSSTYCQIFQLQLWQQELPCKAVLQKLPAQFSKWQSSRKSLMQQFKHISLTSWKNNLALFAAAYWARWVLIQIALNMEEEDNHLIQRLLLCSPLLKTDMENLKYESIFLFIAGKGEREEYLKHPPY